MTAILLMESNLRPKRAFKNKRAAICLLLSVLFAGVTAAYADVSTAVGSDNITTKVCSLITKGDFDSAGRAIDKADPDVANLDEWNLLTSSYFIYADFLGFDLQFQLYF